MRTLHRTFLLALLTAVLLPAAALAQATRTVAGVGVGLESYRFDDAQASGVRSLSLLTIPLAVRVPLSTRVMLEVNGAYARGELEALDGTVAELSGPTDTYAQLSLAVVPDRLYLAVVGLVPTGKAKQTNAEAQVAGAIAADLLSFRITNWSSGGGIGLTTTAAHSFGRVGMGVSAAWLMGREFDLLDGEEYAYRPGNQLLVRAAIDALVGPASKVGLQLTLQQSSEDQVNGANLYRPGDRYQALATYSMPAGRGSAMFYAGGVHRSNGVYLLQQQTAPSEDLLVAGTRLRLPVGRVVIQPSGDLRLIRRESGENQGFAAGAGASLELGLGSMTLLPSAHARFGNVLVRDGVETGFTGTDFGLTIRFGGRS